MPKIELTKEECLEAFNHILHCDRDTCSNISDAYRNDLSTLHTLINEHFDNTLDFKHFKLHSDSTLMAFKKKELVDYIHMVYHNWQNADWCCNNVIKYAESLQKRIDELESNPPLKFEELENSWVWDNKYKGYIFVGNYRKLSKRYRMFHINDEDILYLTEDDFEENRFYRFQCEGDDKID